MTTTTTTSDQPASASRTPTREAPRERSNVSPASTLTLTVPSNTEANYVNAREAEADRAGSLSLAATVEPPALVTALGLVARAAAGGRTVLPILANVLLEATGDQLRLACTDMEWALRVRIPAKVATSGSYTVPASRLLDFVRTLDPGVAVSLVREPGQPALTVRTVGGYPRASLKGIELQEYLVIPQVPDAAAVQPSVTLPAATVRQAIHLTAFSAALDEVRPVLAGIHLIVADGHLLAETADGYRLSVWQGMVSTAGVASTAGEASTPGEASGGSTSGGPAEAPPETTSHAPGSRIDTLIRASQAAHLASLLAAAGEGSTVSLWTLPLGAGRANQLALRFPHIELGGVEAVLRLLDGQFPDLARVTPIVQTTQAVCELEPLLLASKRAILFCQDGGNALVLACRPPDAAELVAVRQPAAGDQQDQVDGPVQRRNRGQSAPRRSRRRGHVVAASTDHTGRTVEAGGTVHVAASGAEIGEGQDDVPALIEGAPLAIRLNASYLAQVLQALKVAGARQVRLSFTTPLSPMRIEGVGGAHLDDYRHVVMPVAPISKPAEIRVSGQTNDREVDGSGETRR